VKIIYGSWLASALSLGALAAVSAGASGIPNVGISIPWYIAGALVVAVALVLGGAFFGMFIRGARHRNPFDVVARLERIERTIEETRKEDRETHRELFGVLREHADTLRAHEGAIGKLRGEDS